MPRLVILLFPLLAGAAAAQQTFLNESFATGVPPVGWVEGSNGNSAGWELDGARTLAPGHAFHDDYFGYNDNFLMSPALDFSTAATVWLHADQDVYFASWRDHHYIEASLNGGGTFLLVQDDVSPDGYSYLEVDLGAFAGISAVNLSFRYTGDYASEWGLDNVLIDDVVPPPPAILTTLVNPTNGHTYHLLDVSTWSKAEAAAVGLGGHLATVDDAAENAWITSSFGAWGGVNRTLWIGLNDVAVEGVFVWADGTPVGYTNWNAGEPNNSTANDPLHGEDYVMIYGTGGTWNDLHDTNASVYFPNLCGVVEVGGPPGPTLTLSNLVAGGTATLALSFCTPGGIVRSGYSLVGGGPLGTPYGNLLLTPPLRELPPLVADPSGNASRNLPVPPGTSGQPVWLHAFDLGSLSFTNGVFAVVG